jgi:hypothetical protein
LNDKDELVQPIFTIDKKKKQPQKFFILFQGESKNNVKPQKKKVEAADPRKFFSYKPVKIGRKLLIESDESYVVPPI